jgi:hypothetical protein
MLALDYLAQSHRLPLSDAKELRHQIQLDPSTSFGD